MNNDINSVHIEYIKKSVDDIKHTLDTHIRDEMHNLNVVKDDIAEIKLEVQKNNIMRTGIVVIVTAFVVALVERLGHKLIP
jgi:CHASE3 domain sensor protein